jgi:hypothetical protein
MNPFSSSINLLEWLTDSGKHLCILVYHKGHYKGYRVMNRGGTGVIGISMLSPAIPPSSYLQIFNYLEVL